MKYSKRFGWYAGAFCIIVLIAAACIAPALPGNATPGIGPGGDPADPAQEHQKTPQALPPESTIAACDGRISGDNCTFMDRESLVYGTCNEKPGIRACAPEKSGPDGQVTMAKSIPRITTSFPVTPQPGTTTTTLPVTVSAGTFVLKSDAGSDGGTLPDEYSCDGAGASPELSWSGAPAGTTEYALMTTTLPVDGSTRWNWILYHIPGTATGIARNGSFIGILGTGSHGTVMQYDPPCSQGPGAKLYTFTHYALSGSPVLPANPEAVTGPVLTTSAITPVTLCTASLNLNHARKF